MRSEQMKGFSRIAHETSHVGLADNTDYQHLFYLSTADNALFTAEN